METVYYKSYKELVSEYFGIDYKVGENAPKLSKQLSKKGIEYTQEELQAFAELLLAVFSVNGDYAEVQGNYFCSDDCASMEYVWSEYYSEYILIDDSSRCDDCGDSFYHDDMEEGSDGCLYCSNCIYDHLEDEEEIA